MIVSFEIHTYRDGAWKIDSVFDDRELALSEAKRMEEKNRFGAIRVLEETFNEASNAVSSRTIYRSTKLDAQNKEATARQVANDRSIKSQKISRSAEQTRIRQTVLKEEQHKSYAGMIVKLGLLLIFGLVLMTALRYLKS